MNSWVFRHLDELRRIYGRGADHASDLPLVTPAPTAEDGILEVAGPGTRDGLQGSRPTPPSRRPGQGRGPSTEWERGGPSLN